jgi:DNA-binding GntR family transcriptional regulator
VLTRLSVLMVNRDSAQRNAPHTYAMHRDIAEAVIAGDVERAERLMAEHLDDIEAAGVRFDRAARRNAKAAPSGKRRSRRSS